MGINRNRTLEDQIRKLKRDINMFKIEFEKLHERFDAMDKRFNGLENQMDKLENRIEDFKTKTGKSFIVVAGGFKAAGHEPFTNELKEIWKENWE